MTPADERRWRELSDALRADIHAIRKQLEAIQENSKADKNTEHPEPEKIVVSELRLPVAVAAYYDAEQRDRPGQARWRRIRFVLEFAALFVAGALAFITNSTLGEIKRQTESSGIAARAAKDGANAARESLTSVQRAFIIPHVPETTGILKEGPDRAIRRWEFRVPWENTGSTPSRRARNRVNVKAWTAGLPKGFRFDDLKDESPTQLVFGPRSILKSGAVTASPEEVEQAKTRKGHLYFWGWITYYDIFADTPMRLTKFCFELTEFSGDAFRIGPNMPLNG
ncbi:MAG: hypothetical protein ACRD2L_11300, partial [Terriglobia bacterium]